MFLLQLLVSLVSSYRYEGDEVNMTLAKQEAKLIHEKIKDKHYSDEDVIRILSTRSKAQINATFNRYQDEHGEEILKVMAKLFSIHVNLSFLFIFKIIMLNSCFFSCYRVSRKETRTTNSSDC